MTTVLKPCPFCGGCDVFFEPATFVDGYFVCNDCLARGPIGCQTSDREPEPGFKQARARWNNRPTTPTRGSDE